MAKITIDPFHNPVFDNSTFSFETVNDWLSRYSHPLRLISGDEPSVYIPNGGGTSGRLIFDWVPYTTENFPAEYFPVFSNEDDSLVREVHVVSGTNLASFGDSSRITSDTLIVEWTNDGGKTITQYPVQKIESTTGLSIDQFYDQPIANFLNGNDEINGSKAGDDIDGFSGSDFLNGLEGGDLLSGGYGDDFIDGGDGIDCTSFMGSIDGYTVMTGDANLTVMDNSPSRDGVDTLANVERLAFTDTMLALDTAANENAGNSYLLYQAAFDRTPDVEGLGYWISKVDGGANIVRDVAQNFILSSEFKSLYGANPSVPEFMGLLYQNVLNRTPDAEGLKYWLDEFAQAGDSTLYRAGLLNNFAISAENIANVADQIVDGIQYQAYVG